MFKAFGNYHEDELPSSVDYNVAGKFLPRLLTPEGHPILGDIIRELFVELWMIPIFGAKKSKRTSTANPNLVWWDGALAVGTVDISIITAWSLFLDKIHLKPTAMPSVTSHRSPTGSSKRCQRFILFPNLPIGTVAENRHGHRVRWRKAPFLDEDEPQQ